MIIISQKFQEICSTILAATDSAEISTLTETLELKVENKVLYLNVTNGEYYASVKFDLESDEQFHAAVNANLFLKLIAAVTTEDIELQAMSNYVLVKANGTYKIPMIFEGDKLLSLPKIEVKNPTVSMKVSGSVLESILNYNSKELSRLGFKYEDVLKDETGDMRLLVNLASLKDWCDNYQYKGSLDTKTELW